MLKCKINIVAACLIAEAKGADQMWIVGKSEIVELIEDFKFTQFEYVAHPNVKNNAGERNRE